MEQESAFYEAEMVFFLLSPNYISQPLKHFSLPFYLKNYKWQSTLLGGDFFSPLGRIDMEVE